MRGGLKYATGFIGQEPSPGSVGAPIHSQDRTFPQLLAYSNILFDSRLSIPYTHTSVITCGLAEYLHGYSHVHGMFGMYAPFCRPEKPARPVFSRF